MLNAQKISALELENILGGYQIVNAQTYSTLRTLHALYGHNRTDVLRGLWEYLETHALSAHVVQEILLLMGGLYDRRHSY